MMRLDRHISVIIGQSVMGNRDLHLVPPECGRKTDSGEEQHNASSTCHVKSCLDFTKEVAKSPICPKCENAMYLVASQWYEQDKRLATAVYRMLWGL